MAIGEGIPSKPTEGQTGQVLTPAIVAHYQLQDSEVDSVHMAMAVLLDATGDQVVYHTLDGKKTLSVNGNAAILTFTFADLSISAPGQYQIRIDVYVLNGGATFLKTLGQFPISVV